MKRFCPLFLAAVISSHSWLGATEPMPANVWPHAEPATWYREPFKVRTENGSPIDLAAQLSAESYVGSSDTRGHAGPFFGITHVHYRNLPDLVVGGFSGRFRIYRNVGSYGAPVFAADYAYLAAGSKTIRTDNFCCVAPSPHFVDLDGDGRLDFVCNSYGSGFQWARGLENGDFGPLEYLTTESGAIVTLHPEKLKTVDGSPAILTPQLKSLTEEYGYRAHPKTVQDGNGKPVEWTNVIEALNENLGSFCDTIDWNNDGRLDLLVGTVHGEIFHIQNVGTRTHPVFSNQAVEIRINGEKAIPDEHAAVAVADWDGDGLPDILVGTYTGAVYLLHNSGKPGAPEFTTREQLIPPGEYQQWLEPGEEPRRGFRAQLQVVDYNQDGKPDIILGDCSESYTPRANLSDEESKQMRVIQGQLMKIRTSNAYLVDPVTLTLLTKDQQSAYHNLGAELSPYLETYSDPNGRSDHKSHGFIWVFLHR